MRSRSRLLTLPLTLLLALCGIIFAPTTAHAYAITFQMLADPLPDQPGGAYVTVTGTVQQLSCDASDHCVGTTPSAGTIKLDGIDQDGIEHSNIASAAFTGASSRFAVSTDFGAGRPGTVQIRASYFDRFGLMYARTSYISFQRVNQISITAPANNASMAKGSTITLAGSAYPARGGDTVLIDVIDDKNAYHASAVQTTLRPDGTWSVALPTTAYPAGKLRIRAATFNGWYARTNYNTYSLTS